MSFELDELAQDNLDVAAQRRGAQEGLPVSTPPWYERVFGAYGEDGDDDEVMQNK